MESAPELADIQFYTKLLTSWGFTPDEICDILPLVLDPSGPRNTVIDYGTTALDVKHRGRFERDKYMGGLALVGQDNRVIGTDEPFVEPAEAHLEGGHAGGIGNAANAIGRLLQNERAEMEIAGVRLEDITRVMRQKAIAIIARLGADPAGRHWVSQIHPMVDTSLLQPVIGYSSGLSDIRIQSEKVSQVGEEVEEGDRAIYFRAGASGATHPERQDLLDLAIRRPTNFNISYPGLFPDGIDQNRGASLQLFIREAQKVCPMVSFDVHGFTKMEHIEPALHQADLWNMNLGEAARIYLNEKIEKPDELADAEKMDLYGRIEERVQNYVGEPDGRPRMFTISDRKGCFVIFKKASGKIQSEYCHSQCADIGAKDKTGAGDVRFGVQRFFLAREKADAWMDGSMSFEDAKLAVQMGQIASTLQVQGKEADAFAGVTLASIRQAAESGEHFPAIEALLAKVRN